MSDFLLLQSEEDETGRLVELVKYIGGDGLMPVFNVKVDGVLVFHSEELEQAEHEYSMECV
jgi:hypothetical protein|tara:strand:- start:444 stop:626 length:183 start_codon:yes stop_codon:yes gene_type:complete